MNANAKLEPTYTNLEGPAKKLLEAAVDIAKYYEIKAPVEIGYTRTGLVLTAHDASDVHIMIPDTWDDDYAEGIKATDITVQGDAEQLDYWAPEIGSEARAICNEQDVYMLDMLDELIAIA